MNTSHDLNRNARLMTRNFYGTLRVKDTGPEDERNGDAAADAWRDHAWRAIPECQTNAAASRPTTLESSGVGLAIKYFQQDGPLRVGVVGLGTGHPGGLWPPGDVIRFYEINPQVIDIARRDFNFIADSPAQVDTVLGDARLTMEREAPQQYDVLAIDAFSSDAIPVHLITREAMAIYLKHIKPDGVIAFHVTNRFLKLAPVVEQIAETYGLQTVLIADDEDEGDRVAHRLGAGHAQQETSPAESDQRQRERNHRDSGVSFMDRRFQQPGADPEIGGGSAKASGAPRI